VDLRKIELTRETEETKVRLTLRPDEPKPVSVRTEAAFLNHLLEAMCFHGGISLEIDASGDTDVDLHHLVEDVGLVLGDALHQAAFDFGPVRRFGHSVIPMDEALSEVVVDVCGRPTLVFSGRFPQERIGDFDAILVKEFLTALTARARIALHGILRAGENSHHMAESLFKALGRSLADAYARGDAIRSTKGTLDR